MYPSFQGHFEASPAITMLFLVGNAIDVTSQGEHLLKCHLATMLKTNPLQWTKNLKTTNSVVIPAV